MYAFLFELNSVYDLLTHNSFSFAVIACVFKQLSRCWVFLVLLPSKSIYKYLKNSSWMLLEYSLQIVSGLFVGIVVARYLGPEQFGILSFVLAIFTIFLGVSRLGMESVLVRDISRSPDLTQSLMGTAFYLMLAAGVASYLIIAGLVVFMDVSVATKSYILIVSLGLLLQPFFVVDFSFQGQVKAKYPSIAKSVALATSAIVKTYLVYVEASLAVFAMAYAFDIVFLVFFLNVMHLFKKQSNFLTKFKRERVLPLLKSCYPIVLSVIAGLLYMKIDQIMIHKMLGSHELGLYSAATKLYEAWIMLPVIISLSLLPAIVKLKEVSSSSYEKNLVRLFSLLFWLSLLVAIPITVFSNSFVEFTYGVAFLGSAKVVVIVFWTAAFAAIGSASARYLTVEGMENKIAFRAFFGLIINVALNFILIPVYGIEGAAMATLFTVFIVHFVLNYFDKELLQLRRICNNAVLMRNL